MGSKTNQRTKTNFESALLTLSLFLFLLATGIILGYLLRKSREGENCGLSAEELRSNRTRRPENNSTLLHKICVTPSCVHSAAKILENMEDTMQPCDDFYTFACGRFIKETIIPDDKTSVTVFSLLADKVRQQLRLVLEEPRNPREPMPYRLAKDLYTSCMNTEKVESRGLQPILGLIRKLGGWPVVEGTQWAEDSFRWFELMYKFRENGLSVDYFFDFSITSDMKNLTQNVIRIGQAQLSTNREYLVKSFEHKSIQTYYQFQVSLAVALGAEKEFAAKEIKDSTLFEMKLANISLPYDSLKNATSLFNSMTILELQTKFPSIPWLSYLNRMMKASNISLENTERVIVDVISYIKQLEILLNSTPKRTLANYAISRALSSVVQFAPEKLIELKSSWKPERESRWKECVDVVNSKLNHATGSLYIENFFKDEARQNAREMVDGIRGELLKVMNKLGWMDDETRTRAIEKASRMQEQIGYPDQLRNITVLEHYYEGLAFHPDLYLENILNISLFMMEKAFKRLREVGRVDWTTRRTAVVNAFYNKLENAIELPAGILQTPFFSSERPNYLNYGAIGLVIGHEIIHGFDDQGRQFDKSGQLTDWWAKNTEKKFLKKAQCIIEQYGNFSVKEIVMKVNGNHTLTENIADNGGIKIAYKAYLEWMRQNGEEPSLPGLPYTPRQLFWISAANVWCGKSRPEALKLKIVTDTHSPKTFRVIGPFSNIEDFSKDFKCPSGSRMNPVKKCTVW